MPPFLNITSFLFSIVLLGELTTEGVLVIFIAVVGVGVEKAMNTDISSSTLYLFLGSVIIIL